jgi:nitrogen fixation protein NifZ
MTEFHLGDLVYAAIDLRNDPVEETGESGIPGMEPGILLAPAGAPGVIVNTGTLEADPRQTLYLVRFETGPGGDLGQPIGCLPEELSQQAR